jgi:hypothetical protein
LASCLAAANVPDVECYALLEFVRNDDPQQFENDAGTLKQWMEGIAR